MQHKRVQIDDIAIFYREIGRPGAPKLLLLHGLPGSSHQHRDLMRRLGDRFHIVAPDFPGFGHSDRPDPDGFAYTFETLTRTIAAFCRRVGFTRFGLYLQGYSGPVGFRLLTANPDWLEWLIIQNANAYEIGSTVAWDELRDGLWATPSAEREEAVAALLGAGPSRTLYRYGHRKPERLDPDVWTLDDHFLSQPGGRAALVALIQDDRTNIALYPLWQRHLADHQPRTLVIWAQGDAIFNPAGGEAYRTALPDLELHRLDTGHFAAQDSLDEICEVLTTFYDRVVEGGA